MTPSESLAKTDLALLEAQERLEAALTAAEVATYVWDMKADRLYGDRNLNRLFGIELDPDGGAPLSRFVEALHPDDRAPTIARLTEAVEKGTEYRAEYRIINAGQERWVIARGRVEQTREGTPVRFPGVLLDITERKHAEQARQELSERLAQQSRLFEGIASTTLDHIYVFDREGRFLYANKRVLELFGRNFADVVGKTPHELPYPKWHAEMHTRELAQVVRTKQPLAGEVPFVGANGVLGVYEYIFTPVLDPAGEVEVIAGTTRDVTQRRRAEDALRRSMEMMDVALAASETGTFRYDLRRREYIAFDDNLKRLFDFPLEGLPTFDEAMSRIHPDDRVKVTPAMQGVIEESLDFEMEFRVVQRDGQVRWLFDRAKVLRDERGQAVELVGACTDVTRRRASEAAARAASERFRFLAETLPAKIFTANAHGEIEYLSRQWSEFTGVRSEEIVATGWTHFVHPDDVEGNVAAWQGAVAAGATFQYEHRFRRADGVYRWHLTRAEPMRDPDGRLLMWVGSNTDIDDLKRSQEALRETAERLKAAMDASHTGTFRWDLATGTVNWDSNLDRIFGVTETPSARTLPSFFERVHPEDRGAVEAQVRRCTAEGIDFAMEYRVRTDDGRERWIDAKGRMSRDAAGRPAYMIGACLDITERKQAEAERAALLDAERRARSEAESVSRLKDEFLATLSHELRTPLNAILGWSQILQRNHPEGTEVGEGLAVIERNARVQVKLVEDLLDMSRVISGKLRIDTQRVDIAAVVEAALESIMPAANAKGIRVEAMLPMDVGYVRGDAARLQQVFWNLLSNAVKFTPAGGRVQVTLERVNAGIEVTVTDTGIGIEPQFLAHMFERFRQADGATTRRHGGLGLGLAIVKSLVEMHGGTVRARSPGRDRGATFSVELPSMVVTDTAAAGGREGASGIGPALPFDDTLLAGVRVLVVDDEKDARDLIQRVLEDVQAHVATCADAVDAMALLASDGYDVLISDVGMPGEDGFALIRRVRELPQGRNGNVPAVALTAFARSEDRRHALMAGFQAHVAKPFEPAELVAVVASLAGKVGRSRAA